MFHSRGIEVTFLVRESDFWNKCRTLPSEKKQLWLAGISKVEALILILESELERINDDGNGRGRVSS